LSRTRLICLLLTAMTLSIAATATAQTPTRTHRRLVITMLSSDRGFPTDRQLRRTGNDADTVRILTDLAVDRKIDLRLRLNAIRAMEYYPVKKVEEVLMSLLFARKQLLPVQRTCMRALARAFGVKMLNDLIPFLRDVDPKLRAAAAIALAEIEDGRVPNILTNQLVNEPEITVRMAIETGLDMIAERERNRRERHRGDSITP
jgi:HEAT repeat protein